MGHLEPSPWSCLPGFDGCLRSARAGGLGAAGSSPMPLPVRGPWSAGRRLRGAGIPRPLRPVWSIVAEAPLRSQRRPGGPGGAGFGARAWESSSAPGSDSVPFGFAVSTQKEGASRLLGNVASSDNVEAYDKR